MPSPSAGPPAGRARSAVVEIPKAASVERVDENAGSGDLVSTRAEAGELDAAFALGPPSAALPML